MSKARIGHKYTQWSKSARFPLAYVKPPENLVTGDKITRLTGMSPFAWQREDNRTEDKRKLTEREIADADAMGRSDQVLTSTIVNATAKAESTLFIFGQAFAPPPTKLVAPPPSLPPHHPSDHTGAGATLDL